MIQMKIFFINFIIFLISLLAKDAVGKKYNFADHSEKVTPPNKYPFYATVKFSDEHLCSGSVISPTFILSAATCLYKARRQEPDTTEDGTLTEENFVKKFSCGVGNSENTKKTLKVKRIIKHPLIRLNPKDGLPLNVMLIEINEKLEFSDSVRPICITKNYLDDYENATVCAMAKKGNSPTLEEMTPPVWTFEECQNALKNIDTNVGTFFTCVGGMEKGKPVCGADEGAPLFVIKDDKYDLIGTKSRDASSCENELPTLFTKTSVFRRWIKEYAKDYSDKDCGLIPPPEEEEEKPELPFMASVRYKDKHMGSATIVSPTHILSSSKIIYQAYQSGDNRTGGGIAGGQADGELKAECDGTLTDEAFVKEFSIGIGPGGKQKTYEVEKIIKHPMSQMNSSEGLPLDAVLLKLKTPLEFSETTHSISLSSNYPEDYKNTSVASYEYSAGGGGGLGVTKEVTTVWPQKDCQKALKDSDLNEASFVTCAGSKEDKISVREFGAPLYTKNEENGKFELIGIKSSEPGSSDKDGPSLFTKISNLRRWVTNVTGDYCDCDSGVFKGKQRQTGINYSSRGGDGIRSNEHLVVVTTYLVNDTHSTVTNISYHKPVMCPKNRSKRGLDLFKLKISGKGDINGLENRTKRNLFRWKRSEPAKKANFDFYQEYVKKKPTKGIEDIKKNNKKFSNPEDGFPFMVTICFEGFQHVCFGAIVSPNYVLTSANCLYRVSPGTEMPEHAADGTITDESFVDKFSVVIGVSGVKQKTYKVNSILKHLIFERHTEKGLPLDAVLLQLSETLEFSDKLHSICINTNYFENDTDAIVTTAKKELTCGNTELNITKTKIWPHRKCLKTIQRIDTNVGAVVTCAGVGDDLCGVDDGAPLFMKRDDKYNLIGLKSRNPTNCHSSLPTLFTKASVIRRWVRKYSHPEGFNEENCG